MGEVGLMGMRAPGMTWREIREAAVLAEELGYSCLSMGESWGEDALTPLAQLAAVTMTIIGTAQECRDRMQTYFDAGVHEIRLVFNEPDKDAYLRALRAVAPRG